MSELSNLTVSGSWGRVTLRVSLSFPVLAIGAWLNYDEHDCPPCEGRHHTLGLSLGLLLGQLDVTLVDTHKVTTQLVEDPAHGGI